MRQLSFRNWTKNRTLSARTLGIAALTICAALSQACSHQDRELPAENYANFRINEPITQGLSNQWWRSFDSPQLDELVTSALRENFSLRAAWDRLARAEAQARIEGVDLSPKLSAEAGAGVEHTRDDSSGETAENLNLGLFAAYEIDLWGRVRAQSRAAAFEMKATEEDVLATAVILAAELSLRYFELTAFSAEETLIKQQIKADEDILKVLRAQFLNGEARVADVLRQENLIEALVGDLTLVRRDMQLRATQISILLGKEPLAFGVEDLRDKNLPALKPLAKTGLAMEVLRRRPDIRAAYLRIQSSDQSFASALADKYPRISLVANIETRGQSSDLFKNWLFNLAANFFQPILDGGERDAVVESNRAELSEAINFYSATSIAALGEVQTALIEAEHLARYQQSLEKRTKRAVQIVEQLRESYLNRQSAFIDVLAAQTALQDLERELIRTHQGLIAARIALCRAAAGAPELERPNLRDSELKPLGAED